MARRLSVDERVAAFWSKVEKTDTCWYWISPSTNGNATHPYGRFGWREGGRQHSRSAHRYSYELAHGQVPPGLVVRHSCDHTLCVRPEHLLVGTQQANLQDMHDR